jgi:hypothetical protein
VLGPVLLFTPAGAFAERVRFAWLAAGVSLVLSAAVVAGLRRVPSLAVARTIDRAAQLSELLASAWSFAQLSAAQQTPFMRATLARADARARHVEAASVWPLRWPSVLIAWPLLVVGVVWLWQRPLPAQCVRSVERPLPARLLAVAEADAELSNLSRTGVPADDLALRALNDEYARLLELVARQGIDRLPLLRALGELEAKLAATFEHSAQQQAELRELGRVLAGTSTTQQLGAALASSDLAAGQAALQKLARRVEEHDRAHDLEQFRAALRAALDKHAAERRVRMAEARRSQDSALRKRQAEEAGETAAQRAAAKRQLDELLRQERAERQEAAGQASARSRERQLDRLERELDRAAETPSGAQAVRGERADPGRQSAQQPAASDGAQTARELQNAAETLQRMQRDAAHDRALERLGERIAELRQRLAEHDAELKRQAANERSADAGQQQSRAAGEARAAHGTLQPPAADGPEAAQEAQRPSAGEPDAGKQRAERPLTLGEFEKRARGEQARATGPRQPGDAQPSGVLRDPKAGAAPGAAAQASLLERRVGAPENAPTAHGSVQTGSASRSGAADVDVALAGVLGRGPTRRAVIYDAAAQGFGTRGYEKVHADYRDHAENELEREALPAIYRYYVRRYFQLIQPSEDLHE